MTATPRKPSTINTDPFNKELILSLRKMISPLTRRAGDTDDILQEVLLKIHKKGDSVEPSKFLAWLHQVSRTTTIDYYRKNRSYLSLQDQHVENLSSAADEDDQASQQLAKCIRPLLKNLDRDDQKLISAVDLDGTSQTELAEKDGLKYSSLKSKVQRARQKLKDEILDCCQVELDSRKRPLGMKSKKNSSCC